MPTNPPQVPLEVIQAEAVSVEEQCGDCGGTGRNEHHAGETRYGDRYVSVPCNKCSGMGRVARHRLSQSPLPVDEVRVEAVKVLAWQAYCSGYLHGHADERDGQEYHLDAANEGADQWCLDNASTITALSDTPTKAPAMSEEWCLNMAQAEGDAEIGAGAPDHPLRCPPLPTPPPGEYEGLVERLKAGANEHQRFGEEATSTDELIDEATIAITTLTQAPGSLLNECVTELGDAEPFVVQREADGWAVRTMSGWRVLNPDAD